MAAEEPVEGTPEATSAVIRGERPEDRAGIRRIHAEAFGRPEEANLVDALRAGGSIVLSMVADAGARIVGHILYSPVSIHTRTGTRSSLGLAPLAVLPAWQRKGIGASLVRTSLERLRAQGHGSVVVLGHPWFYPRFGFRPASTWGLRWEHPCPPETFMAVELHPGALEHAAGLVRFCREFEGV